MLFPDRPWSGGRPPAPNRERERVDIVGSFRSLVLLFADMVTYDRSLTVADR